MAAPDSIKLPQEFLEPIGKAPIAQQPRALHGAACFATATAVAALHLWPAQRCAAAFPAVSSP